MGEGPCTYHDGMPGFLDLDGPWLDESLLDLDANKRNLGLGNVDAGLERLSGRWQGHELCLGETNSGVLTVCRRRNV